MSSEPQDLPRCSHVSTCELFPRFRTKAFAVWQTFYCLGSFEACARYKLALGGKVVPPNLLPNGKVLELPILGVSP